MVFLNDQQRLLLAFTKYAHASQKRKYTEAPYWHHPLSVAQIILLNVPDLGWAFLAEIALLHDVLEDTRITVEEMADFLLYGAGYSQNETEHICTGVLALTDKYTGDSCPELNRDKRKILETFRLQSIHEVYKTVKCADLIDNTASIVEHDPGFAKVYLKEKEQVLAAMTGADSRILKMACSTLEKAKATLSDF